MPPEHSQDPHELAAAKLLTRLLDDGEIEFVTSRGVSALAPRLARVLAEVGAQPGRAGAVADWLVEEVEVRELFASDERVEALLASELDPRLAELDDGALPASARHAELETQIFAALGDRDELLLIYADWLQGRGDPLGEYVALQAVERRHPSAKHRRARLAFARAHARYLEGGLRDYRTCLRLDWHLGFVEGARMWTSRADRSKQFQGPILFDWLFALPAARFLRRIELGPHTDSGQRADVVAKILERPRVGVQELIVRDQSPYLRRFGVIADIAACLPNLRTLELDAEGHVELAGLSHPLLSALRLRFVGHGSSERAEPRIGALSRAQLPALRELELELYATDWLELLAPIVRGVVAPGLKRLVLRLGQLGDRVIEELLGGGLPATLEQLELSRSAVREGGAKLAAQLHRFGRLRALVLDGAAIDDALRQRCEALGIGLRAIVD